MFFFFFFFGEEEKWQNLLQTLYRTLLGRVQAYLLKPKKPVSRTNTPPAEPPFGFKLHGSLVPLKSHTTLPSSVRPELLSAATRLLGKPTSRAIQGRNKQIPPPNDADSQVYPRRKTAGAGPDAISTGPPRCFAPDAHQVLSSSSQV